MDNASYHSMLIEAPPTSASSWAVMMQWVEKTEVKAFFAQQKLTYSTVDINGKKKTKKTFYEQVGKSVQVYHDNITRPTLVHQTVPSPASIQEIRSGWNGQRKGRLNSPSSSVPLQSQPHWAGVGSCEVACAQVKCHPPHARSEETADRRHCPILSRQVAVCMPINTLHHRYHIG